MLNYVIIACATESGSLEGDANIGLAQMYLEEFSDFKSWEQDDLWEGVQPSQSAHGLSVQIWLNGLAMDALENEEPYPIGSAIMKEGYVDEAGSQRKALTLMVKREEYEPDSGNWFWASYSDTNDVQMAGSPEYCVSCHSASSSDYVLFTEEE